MKIVQLPDKEESYHCFTATDTVNYVCTDRVDCTEHTNSVLLS